MSDLVESLGRHAASASGELKEDLLVAAISLRAGEILLTKAAAEIDRLQKENERLRAALEPLSKLWLYPDDLGFEESEDIRADPDWDEDANDMQTDDQFILRKHIRAARKLLGGGDE